MRTNELTAIWPVQLAAAFLGTAGFAVLFGVPRDQYLPVGFCGLCGWTVYRYLKNNENRLSTFEIRRALSFYMDFASCKPSLLHSCIMIQAANFEKKHENESNDDTAGVTVDCWH